MLKSFSMISIMLLGSVVVIRAQQTSNATPSDADKTGVIESVLDLERSNRYSSPDFDNIKYVSSESIEFIDSTRLSNRGYTLVAANQLCELQKNRVVKYLLFTNVSAGDAVVNVAVSHIRGGRACFEGRFYSERSYKYEVTRTSAGWTAQLTHKPMPSFFSERKRSNTVRGIP
jgi:hypothetical protein